MNNSIYKVLVIVFSFSLSVLVLECTRENNVFGAEFEFPEELLSQTVEWEKCELFETQKMWRKAECTDITVPLYWDSPEGETMTIRVKRLKALVKATEQMWLLDGGPGGDGTAALPELMKTIARLDWNIDLYTLDHRGGGYSNRLTCPDQENEDSDEGLEISESEWDACIDYLEDTYNLDAITVTQAAKDVGFLVELLTEKDKEIFVYGISYGTYWAHRYAQIFPDQADGIILDSVATPFFQELDQYDINGNETVKNFFDMCKEDSFCSSKMGDDPWGKANDAFEKFKNGHCNEVYEHGLIPEFLQVMAFTGLDYWYLRLVVPALYYRLDRCNEGDVSALKHMWDIISSLYTTQFEVSEIPDIPRHYTPALQQHVLLSEMMPDNPISPEEMEGIDKTLLASQHYAYQCLQQFESWPVYETDEYYRNWASQDVPILMLNGTLDQRTIIEEARIAKDYLNGPNQYFIEIPNAIHAVVFYNKLGAPVKNIFEPGCGIQIMLDYTKNPLAEPDTSCLDNLKPVDFRGNPLLALAFFGTWDLWENGINKNISDDQIFLMKKEADNILRDLRQRWPRLR